MTATLAAYEKTTYHPQYTPDNIAAACPMLKPTGGFLAPLRLHPLKLWTFSMSYNFLSIFFEKKKKCIYIYIYIYIFKINQSIFNEGGWFLCAFSLGGCGTGEAVPEGSLLLATVAGRTHSIVLKIAANQLTISGVAERPP